MVELDGSESCPPFLKGGVRRSRAEDLSLQGNLTAKTNPLNPPSPRGTKQPRPPFFKEVSRSFNRDGGFRLLLPTRFTFRDRNDSEGCEVRAADNNQSCRGESCHCPLPAILTKPGLCEERPKQSYQFPSIPSDVLIGTEDSPKGTALRILSSFFKRRCPTQSGGGFELARQFNRKNQSPSIPLRQGGLNSRVLLFL